MYLHNPVNKHTRQEATQTDSGGAGLHRAEHAFGTERSVPPSLHLKVLSYRVKEKLSNHVCKYLHNDLIKHVCQEGGGSMVYA